VSAGFRDRIDFEDPASSDQADPSTPAHYPSDASAIDLAWMREAMLEARRADELDEVPVGAVLVRDGVEVARGHNRTILDRDPTAHAEIIALRAAAHRTGDHRVGGTLYVTLEPCSMCMGAMVQARVERLVFATRDPKAGAAVSLYSLGSDARLNHRFPASEGALAGESAELLRAFFRRRRSG
jgi:tRNA(adenine34) deaminase